MPFTQEQLDEAFAKYDRDKSGKLDKGEATQLLLDIIPGVPAEKMITSIIRNKDKGDGDEKIDRQEFADFYQYIVDKKKKIDKAFNQLKDAEGYVRQQDLIDYVDSMEEPGIFGGLYTDDLMEKFDANKDGKISIEEFSNLWGTKGWD